MPETGRSASEKPTDHVLYDSDYPRRPWRDEIGPTRTARDRDDRVTDILARETAARPEGRPSRRGPGARQPGRDIAPFLRRGHLRR
jgi:hypothetical protein